ncbi:MAG TPA: hypothetical protein VGQ00_04580 [Candidatus Norongarragalinales archaeon]|jgi:hypothetical protein|nr:hypothetical protein [Candidatus Norongarragalinales archaeon]
MEPAEVAQLLKERHGAKVLEFFTREQRSGMAGAEIKTAQRGGQISNKRPRSMPVSEQHAWQAAMLIEKLNGLEAHAGKSSVTVRARSAQAESNLKQLTQALNELNKHKR